MLNSLQISNFKGIKEIRISTLGRLNLIVGKNNSGKSSILEALMLYASGGSEVILDEISQLHDEKSRYSSAYDDEKKNLFGQALPYEHLFYGRQFTQENEIFIGEFENDFYETNALRVRYIKNISDIYEMNSNTLRVLKQLNILSDDLHISDNISRNFLEILQGNFKHIIPLEEILNRTHKFISSENPNTPNYMYVPTSFTSMNELGELWDDITLTPYEKRTIEALKLIEPNIEDLRFIEERRRRTALIKLMGEDTRFPLRSMGDGIVRILQLILNMYAAKGGIYLIDEFDNGLHYSVQKALWELIFDLADELDIQVFATTHSWDCIQSFTEVAIEKKNIKGALLKVGKSKLSKKKGTSIVTVFDEDKLHTITQTLVEVR
jgi:AAA15 family ATPase/GTPase